VTANDEGLRKLADLATAEFPALFGARERTEAQLEDRTRKLADLGCDRDIAVVLMGSWGRGELTSESDDDFMVLVNGAPQVDLESTMDAVSEVLGDDDRRPGREGIFGQPVSAAELRENIGLDRDSNANLTRRMLLLLESVPVYHAYAWAEARSACLQGYMEPGVKPYRPPRFLLNDIVRYWRTLAVDFEGKHRSRRGEGWGLRSAKLRMSRKLLFASGLLPVLECHDRDADEIPAFLAERLTLLPADRVAEAFLAYGAVEPGVRAFRAYNEFLTLMDDGAFRAKLEALPLEEADGSEEFQHVRNLGRQFQGALLTLLFDTPDLYSRVREFAIF
jgi:hypothetical protein